MKLGHLVAFGFASCAGFAAYQTYQKRDQIKADIADANEISDKIAEDITKFIIPLKISINNCQNYKQLAKS